VKLLRFSLFVTFALSVAAPFAAGQGPSLPDRFVPEEKGITRLEKDLNGDGKVDDILWFDARGNRVKESLDTNFDGKMDTFYYYNSRGVLSHVEVDTSFDGKIDLWVWLTEGVYVTRYERDTDGDGKADTVKVFGPATDADTAQAADTAPPDGVARTPLAGGR